MAKIGWKNLKSMQVARLGMQDGRKNRRFPGFYFILQQVPCILYLTVFSSVLYACPMCGDILERGKDALASLRFSKGISWSILLMLSVPYLLVGGVALMIFRAAKKAKSKEERGPWNP